ncbi:hypothetical protein L6164_014297 [Bauhinia variegata]|uniref:Uncharacterized protein n=1 Tax=Bauhinia variegata TaxID=167791 RepID=A0ACB9NH36_BAUVA|nr:hypothetical protein L6164_014297 [Bauhinia variegata]
MTSPAAVPFPHVRERNAMGLGSSRLRYAILALFFFNVFHILFAPSYFNFDDHSSTSPPQHFDFLSTHSTIKHLSPAHKLSRLERIEGDLARARASIQEAIRSSNFAWHDTGSIYWNPRAFHQSHVEMLKRFKVWVYEEGEQPLVHDGPVNDIYAIEGQFIDEIDNSNRSPFKATHPDKAQVFFLPFSVAKVIRFVYKPRISKSDYDPDRLQRLVEDYITIISHKYPYWNASMGADHFLLSCHDWGPRISYGNPEMFKNFIRVLCNANASEGFQPSRDVSIPEVKLPKGKLVQRNLSKHPDKRTILAFFAGRVHGNIRKKLLKRWKAKDDQIRVHEYLPKGEDYAKLMGLSKFCLCPSGNEVASPRVVEAIQAGCVPVIICDNYTLPFSDVLNWSQFSVEIPVEKIPEIKNILQNVPKDEYLKMYNNVRKVRRHFVVNRPAKPFDMMHMILHSIWLRRLNFRIIAS